MLPKINRIKKKKDFEFIFKNSKSFRNNLFILKTAKNNLGLNRFGFVVSKKISNKATVRNKIKRRLSEAVKIAANKTETGKDAILIALPGIEKKLFYEIKKFISMKLQDRILFVKEFIADAKDDEEEETIEVDSARAKSIKFLNALEVVLNNNIFKNKDFNNFDFFEQIFKVRQFLRQPGSSAKTLLESVAISIPIL